MEIQMLMKPIDVASNGLLKYSNEDGGDSFQYRIANIEQITYFELAARAQEHLQAQPQLQTPKLRLPKKK